MQTSEAFLSGRKTTILTPATTGKVNALPSPGERLFDSDTLTLIQAQPSYLKHHIHIRVSELIFVFRHDGISIEQDLLPDLTDKSDYEQELIIQEWKLNAPKRVVDIETREGDNYIEYLEPLECIYTQKGLTEEWDLLAFRGKNFYIFNIDDELAFSSPTGLKGQEKAEIHVSWDEYLTVATL
jgi:hypothetical protein